MGTLVRLKGGFSATDRRLGRVPRHDPRSLRYPVAAALPAVPKLRPVVWPMRWRLDQGQQGACLLFAFTHNVLGRPTPRRVRIPGSELYAANAMQLEAVAFERYRRAQELDEWPGAEPDYSGTSTIAAAKSMAELGLLGEYRWALRGIDDVLAALSGIGPVVFSTVWLSGMFDARPSGVLDVSGTEDGGHGYDIIGWHRDARNVRGLRGEGIKGPVLVGVNSWGASWGLGGMFYLPVEDQGSSRGAEWLLGRERMGECCIPLVRAVQPRPRS